MPPYVVSYIACAAYLVTGVIGFLLLKNLKFLESFIVALVITIILKIIVLVWILTDYQSSRFILTIVSLVVVVSETRVDSPRCCCWSRSFVSIKFLKIPGRMRRSQKHTEIYNLFSLSLTFFLIGF